jgi:acyl-coenzyme A synthetase/AMP-(fatty) acid ligase
MQAQQITVANLTPAMAQLLCEQSTGERIDSLRYSFLVGDVLTHRDVARLKQLAPAITCVNLYGATETQRAVGYYVPDEAPAQAAAKPALPLGTGITDVQLLVLNRQQQICGVGELGEICFRTWPKVISAMKHLPPRVSSLIHSPQSTMIRLIDSIVPAISAVTCLTEMLSTPVAPIAR